MNEYQSKRIVFMGTPDFAEVALRALCEAGYSVVGVLTQPDKPKGRGHVMTPPPVKEYALSRNIPVYQPQTLKNGAFDGELSRLNPDLIVVAAYGKILPASVIGYPPFGCINIHGSLLPAYRGAAPIQRALMDGEAKTGVTIMRMDEGLDTGDMLSRVETEITDSDNFETLHDRMARIGAEALLAALPSIFDGTITAEKQDDALATYAKKIEKEDCYIDFSRPAREIFCRIRGLSPIPLAFAEKGGVGVKIPSAQVGKIDGKHGEPGEVLSLGGGVVTVACGEGTLLLTEVLPLGKKRMRAADWINGRGVAVGDIFETPAAKDGGNGNG